MAIVDVTDTRTGDQRRVPERWIGHPVLGPHLVRGNVAAPTQPPAPVADEQADGAPAVATAPPEPGRGKPKAPRAAGDQKED